MKKCDLCHESDKVHYRVKSKIHKNWIFCCKKCWNIISKQDDYSYGGTRKLNWKISRQINSKTNEVIKSFAFRIIKINSELANKIIVLEKGFYFSKKLFNFLFDRFIFEIYIFNKFVYFIFYIFIFFYFFFAFLIKNRFKFSWDCHLNPISC